jgi:hypothetical protein
MLSKSFSDQRVGQKFGRSSHVQDSKTKSSFLSNEHSGSDPKQPKKGAATKDSFDQIHQNKKKMFHSGYRNTEKNIFGPQSQSCNTSEAHDSSSISMEDR